MEDFMKESIKQSPSKCREGSTKEICNKFLVKSLGSFPVIFKEILGRIPEKVIRGIPSSVNESFKNFLKELLEFFFKSMDAFQNHSFEKFVKQSF